MRSAHSKRQMTRCGGGGGGDNGGGFSASTTDGGISIGYTAHF